MDGEVGAKKARVGVQGTGRPSNETRKKNAFGGKESGSSIVSATHSAISGPIQTSPPLPSLISVVRGVNGPQNERVGEI